MSKIQPGYYCAHALKDNFKTIRGISDCGHFKEDVKSLTAILGGLEDCKKFLVPYDTVSFLDANLKDEKINELITLPFPEVAFEIDTPFDCGCVVPTILLVSGFEGLSKWNILLHVILKIDGVWNVQPLRFWINCKEGVDCEKIRKIKLERGWDVADKMRWTELPAFTNLLEKNIDEFGIEGMTIKIQEELHRCGAYVPWVCKALISINLKNVKTLNIPPPEKLNKKRKRSGKLPLYGYKVLDIHLSKIKKNKYLLSPNGEERNRAHICRGHFKKRKTGIYWWNAHMRGDKNSGLIEKDYRVMAGAINE